MNYSTVMELIGVVAATAAIAFFLFGRRRRLSGFPRIALGLLLVTVVANSVIDALEHSGALTLDIVEDYVDLLPLMAWVLFSICLLNAFPQNDKPEEEAYQFFIQQLTFAFAILIALNLAYSLTLFVKTRNTVEQLSAHRGPAVVAVVQMKGDFNEAVEEAFAYIVSGDAIEKEEFEHWAQSKDVSIAEFRRVARLDSAEEREVTALLEEVVALQGELVTGAREMFAEFETNGMVTLATFHEFESATDELGTRFERLLALEQTNADDAQLAATSILRESKLEMLILGGVSIVLSAGLFGLLYWSFRKYSREQISARKQLADSENRYRTLIEVAPEAIAVVDVEEVQFVEVNDNMVKLFGLEREQLLQTGPVELSPEHQPDGRESAPTIMKFVLDALDGNNPTFEWLHLDAHGNQIDCEVRLTRVCRRFIRGSVIDISERKRAEETLRQLDQAIRIAKTPIAFGDLDGRITDANQAFAELFGFDSTEQVVGQLNTRFHSEPICVSQINKAIIEGGGFAGEITSKRIDGTPIEIQISATRFADRSGRPVGSMTTFVDVTPKRQVERALREGEQRYRTLVEEAPEAIVVLDVDEGRFVDVNENASELFRLGRKQLLEIGPVEVSPESQPDGRCSAKAAMEVVQRALDGETPAFEWTHVDSEGNEIPCEVRLARLASSRPLVRGSITDIGHRLKLEAALSRRALEAELLHRATVMANETISFDDALQKCVDIVCEMTAWPVGHVYVPSANGTQHLEPTAIWHLANERRFASFREVTERTTFVMGEGLPGRIWESGEPAWIVNVQDDDNFPRNKLCEDLGVKGAFGFPVTVKRETVAILEFFTEGVVEKNDTLLLLVRSVGEQVGRVIERKEADDLIHIQHDLVAAELEKAKRELVTKTRFAAVGHVSAQMAHELRNPLGAVSNALYYLKRHRTVDEGKLREYLQLMDEEVNTCNNIIGSLLRATRVKEPVLSSFDLGAIFTHLMSRHPIPAGVEVRFQAAYEPFEVDADREQLQQVLDNLLKNSLDAVGSAGEVDIRAEHENGQAVVTVQDNGRGISPDQRESVFDLLFTTKPAGTGLGLSICRQIIEGHGGTIELLDDDSPGTRFEIRWPCTNATPKSPELQARSRL